MNPPQSPDLNITEAVWDHLDKERSKRQPTSKEELRNVFQEACRSIADDYFKKWQKKLLEKGSSYINVFIGDAKENIHFKKRTLDAKNMMPNVNHTSEEPGANPANHLSENSVWSRNKHLPTNTLEWRVWCPLCHPQSACGRLALALPSSSSTDVGWECCGAFALALSKGRKRAFILPHTCLKCSQVQRGSIPAQHLQVVQRRFAAPWRWTGIVGEIRLIFAVREDKI